MTVIKDKPKKEQRSIETKIAVATSRLSIDNWDGDGGSFQYFEGYGLCSTCTHFCAIESQYGKVKAICNYDQDLRLNDIDPIKVCTKYSRRGEMALHEMKDIAILIDIPQPKIGF